MKHMPNLSHFEYTLQSESSHQGTTHHGDTRRHEVQRPDTRIWFVFPPRALSPARPASLAVQLMLMHGRSHPCSTPPATTTTTTINAVATTTIPPPPLPPPLPPFLSGAGSTELGSPRLISGTYNGGFWVKKNKRQFINEDGTSIAHNPTTTHARDHPTTQPPHHSHRPSTLAKP